MASRNGNSVYDILTNGWSRQVVELGTGSLGLYIPADFCDEQGVDSGDEVAVKQREGEPVLELHFDDS